QRSVAPSNSMGQAQRCLEDGGRLSKPCRTAIRGVSMISRTIERYGRRRSVLVLIGIVWIFYGVAVIVGPRNNPVSGLPHTYIPEEIRFFLWFVSGIIAITAAFWQSKHGRTEALGFAVLY